MGSTTDALHPSEMVWRISMQRDPADREIGEIGRFLMIAVSGRTRPHRRTRSLLLVVAFVIALQPGLASAQNTASEAGVGAGAALCSLIYGPLKIVYATLGLVFGGMAWGLSGGDGDVLEAVITPAVRGDYVITPDHLRGTQTLDFIGHRPGYEKAYEETPPPSGGFESTY
jgi:hypothetical protein